MAIRAVTKDDMRRVDLGSELNVAAVASSCDFHPSTSAEYVTVLDAQRLNSLALRGFIVQRPVE